MTEKSCARCGQCCMVLPLFTQHMHPEFRKYLLTRGLKEDKEQGCILIPNVCQHLIPPHMISHTTEEGNTCSAWTTYEESYSCDIHNDPDRPHVCRAFHGQKIIKGSRIYVPPECAFNKEE